jgi:sterol carrier protein 2
MAPNNIPAYVLGVGLTKFIKPRGEREYPEMGYEAGIKAMLDAQVNFQSDTFLPCLECERSLPFGHHIFTQRSPFRGFIVEQNMLMLN